MTCPHCHAPLVATARFCPACGKATAPTEQSSESWPNTAGAPDLVGKEIAGRYRIVAKLGEGGMGAVYRGEQISLKRAVAVKVLKPELGANQMVLRRFNAEAEAVAKLSHPNTVNIYDFGQDSDGSVFIAMELIDGRSLRGALQHEGPFTATRAIAIALQVAASLADAHAHSIVHRDLKPDNVMLQDRGRQKDVVRVLDFGIAKLRDENRATQQAMTQAGDMLGTPQYMAPEQIRGEAIDGRVDIYALGCMIYEMVTGRMPYEAPTVMAMLSKHLLEQAVPPSQRRPDLNIPPAIDQLVLAAMAKNPAARPATMELFGEQLQALLARLPADPNRSGGLSMAYSAGVAPPGFAPPAFAPPMTPPPGPSITPPPPTTPPPSQVPAGHGAPSVAAPTANLHTTPTPAAPAKSRAPVWIALGVLGLGGAGAAVWLATRGDAAKTAQPDQPLEHDPWDDRGDHAQPDPPTPDERDEPDEPDQPAPDEPGPAKPDPWASHDSPSGGDTPAVARKRAAAAAPAGTDFTTIPAGTKVTPPAGFTAAGGDDAQVYVNASRGALIALTPLFPGTNDPDQLAQLWASSTGFARTGQIKVTSAGKQRDAIGFAGKGVSQLIVLYVEPTYRLGLLCQAPTATFARPAFQREMMKFLERGVALP